MLSKSLKTLVLIAGLSSANVVQAALAPSCLTVSDQDRLRHAHNSCNIDEKDSSEAILEVDHLLATAHDWSYATVLCILQAAATPLYAHAYSDLLEKTATATKAAATTASPASIICDHIVSFFKAVEPWTGSAPAMATHARRQRPSKAEKKAQKADHTNYGHVVKTPDYRTMERPN